MQIPGSRGSQSAPVRHAPSVTSKPANVPIAACKTLQFSGTFGNRPYQGPVSLYFGGARRKLMSYNVERLHRQKNNDMSKTQESMDALAQVILKENPDVLALQEVGDKSTLEWLNRQYLKNRYPNIVMVRVANGSNVQVAMMSKANTRVVGVRSHWDEFSKLSAYRGTRDLLEATFETDTGYRFTVFNTHLKSMVGGEGKTNPVRLAQAQAGERILKRKFKNNRNQPHLFVTGDLNTLHQSPEGKEILDTFALKKDRYAHNDLTEVMLKDGKAQPTHDGRDYNGVQRYPDSKLDYTFVSKAVLQNVVKAYVAGQFKQNPWSKASDHLPLVTVFEEPDSFRKHRPVRRTTKTARPQPRFGLNLIA